MRIRIVRFRVSIPRRQYPTFTDNDLPRDKKKQADVDQKGFRGGIRVQDEPQVRNRGEPMGGLIDDAEKVDSKDRIEGKKGKEGLTSAL